MTVGSGPRNRATLKRHIEWVEIQVVADRPLVLVVDDSEDSRCICAEYLEHHLFRVATAEDGHVGIERVFELLPDVIVMDLCMPVLDGLAATRRLKSDERTRHIPVIALTAYAMADSVAEAFAAGCDAVLTKPCLPKELEAAILQQLPRAREESSKR